MSAPSGPPPVVMFVTTGRCGTQWLTDHLQRLYPQQAKVNHEPLGPRYRPREHFRRWDDPRAVLEIPEVRAHLTMIETCELPYVETGWPLFPVLPLLIERIPERLRIVHLTRHPVPTALSHLAHQSYAGSPRDDTYTNLATLGPQDPRVFPLDVDWPAATPYEKCLFWWAQVNLFAEEVEARRGEVPFLRIQAEKMLTGDEEALRRLVAHMDLAWDQRLLDAVERRVDRWHHRTDQDVDPLSILRHPQIVALAGRLGYDAAAVDPQALEERYRGEPDPGLDLERL